MGDDTDVTVRYEETPTERRLIYEHAGRTAVLAQNTDGYAMVAVRTGIDGAELERYYGLDMAIDHAAELLEVTPSALSLPEAAADMGM